MSMMTHKSSAGLDAGPANGPRLLLADHHRELEVACSALLATVDEGCPRMLTKQYRVFERAVIDHMAAEDTIILPGFEGHAPAEAHALGLEHAAIRKLLLQLGIEVELHLVRLETVKHLIDTLHAHAAREDAWMYPWAQVYLPLSARRQLFVRIGRSLRMLAALRARVTAPPPPPLTR